MSDCRIEPLETQVEGKNWKNEDVMVPDTVRKNAERYHDAEKGREHLTLISDHNRTVWSRKHDLEEGFFPDPARYIHGLLYAIAAIVWVLFGTIAVLVGECSFAEAFWPFLWSNLIHAGISLPLYGVNYLWRKRKLRLAKVRVKELEEMGVVRTKQETEIVDNPWYQFAHHASMLRDHFNKKVFAWNVTADAIERQVIEMTDELRRYYEHLVAVREQVLLAVNTAEFLVMRHEIEERDGAGMSKQEITALLSQVDEARQRMEAVFEIDELPFDPAEVTSRVEVDLPDAAPPIDEKQLVHKALAAGRRVPC